MTVQELLDRIDGALDDPSVSDDAVRWTPDQVDARRRILDGQLRREHLRRQQAILVPLLLTPEQREEANRQIGEHFAALIEALRPAVESFGKVLASVGQSQLAVVEALHRATEEQHRRDANLPTSCPPPPEPALRALDPRAYALEARRARGTGPDRQVQHRPPPRRLR